jgi:hypothetical protein
LVRRHKTLEGILAGLDWTPATRDYIERARQIVRPVEDLELADPVPGLPGEPADPEGLEKMNRELGIGSSSSRLLNALRSASAS